MCIQIRARLGEFFFFFHNLQGFAYRFCSVAVAHFIFVHLCSFCVHTSFVYTFASKDLMKFENVQGDLEDDDELIFNFDLISEQLNLKKLKVFICYKSVFIFTRSRRITLVN